MAPADWRDGLQELMADFSRRQAEAKARATAEGAKLDRTAVARAWQAELVDNDLAGPGWPKTAGGLELSLEDQLDYYRMTTAAGMPPHPCQLSFIVAPVLIKFGTPEQQQRFLQPLLRADEFWCQGFSEPGAGSDLASLSTRAVRDGDVFRVDGQKVWTTMADQADWMFTLVRTGAPGRGSDGITYLLIPMTSPGLTVRPLRDITGGAHFAEVFFEDVEVPVENMVGEEGKGWSIMRTSLGHDAKALAPAPLVPTVIALELAAAVGAAAVAEKIAGGARAAVAIPLDDPGWVTAGAQLPTWNSGAMNGEVLLVAGAPDAEVLLVPASSGDGPVLLAVDPSGGGVAVEAEQPLDLTATVGSVTFRDAGAEVLAEGEAVTRALDLAWRRALLTVAADSIGVASRALAMAVAWAGEREQFGRKIGSFQAISHRCADMLVVLEGALSQVFAAAEAEEPTAADCMLAAAAAFDAAVFAAERSIQIHGGIGFTWEHPAHLLLRRARANAVAVGRPEALRDRAVGLLLDQRSGR